MPTSAACRRALDPRWFTRSLAAWTYRNLGLPGLRLLRPRRFADARGYFIETYNERTFSAAGIAVKFVQDNQSFSAKRGTIRGLHFQLPPAAQAKLVRVLQGSVYDVAVDLRIGSPTYGRWDGATLTARRRRAVVRAARICPWVLHAGARYRRCLQGRRFLCAGAATAA